jgi:hypothetical protein
LKLAPAVIVAAALVLSGCGVAHVVGPTPDTFADWTAIPVAPSPELASLVIGGKNGCTLDPAGGVVHILVQDRRTAISAGFLIQNANSFGSCLISSGSGPSSSGWGPWPAAMSGPLTIDDNGSGSFGSGQATELGGRVDTSASSVNVTLADGRTVRASVANGYWFAWWPNAGRAATVTAAAADGTVLATVPVTK